MAKNAPQVQRKTVTTPAPRTSAPADPRDTDGGDVDARTDEELAAAQVQAAQDPAPAETKRRRMVVVDDEEVEVQVPKAFNFTDDAGITKRYEAGPQKMLRSVAEHWYAAAHQVEIK